MRTLAWIVGIGVVGFGGYALYVKYKQQGSRPGIRPPVDHRTPPSQQH